MPSYYTDEYKKLRETECIHCEIAEQCNYVNVFLCLEFKSVEKALKDFQQMYHDKIEEKHNA